MYIIGNQRGFKNTCRWADRNRITFNDGKFEQMVHEKTRDIDIKSYENPKEENTEIKEEVKDLGVVVLSDFKFTKHIENITCAGRAKCGQGLRTVETRPEQNFGDVLQSLHNFFSK